MLLNEIKPSLHLASYIRLYRIIDFNFPNAALIPPKLYSPRPEQCLQFYPRDAETVSYSNAPLTVTGKRAICVGQHTVLQRRQVGHNFLSIQVIFQPGAFYWLTGIPMHELLNQYLDATDIFRPGIEDVNEQLCHATTYSEMIQVIERFIYQLVRRTRIEKHPVDLSGTRMLQEDNRFVLDKFLKDACLCHRQFDRKFTERMGIAPKQFLRIIRFDKAYRMKNRHPKLDWLSIAVQNGYHDYQHLVKDYREFTGYTPPQFFALDNAAPERAFGDAEI